MKNKKLIALIAVFVVAIIIAIPLSASIASTTYTWLLQQCDGIYHMPNLGDCMSYAQFPQWELDDFNHAASMGLWLLWLGIGITAVLNFTVFRRIALGTIAKWNVLSIGLVLAVLLPLLTWRAIINPTYIYACALSLPIGLVSIGLFLMPQTAQRTVLQQAKEPAKPDGKLLSLQQAVQDNPQSFQAWTDLAYHQHKLDLNDDALASANKAISLNNTYSRAWMVRGAALSTMAKKEADALVALEEALRLDENNVDAMYYKGRVYVFQEHDTLAHHMFDRVLARDPMYKDALLSKGSLYLAPDILDDEHFHGALATASELIRQNPNDPVGWRMQGTAYQFRGEQRGVKPEERLNLLSNALASFHMALEIDPTDSNTYLLKAGPYAVLGDYGNALDALNQGLKIDPTNTRLQEAKADIVGKRRKETASKVAGTAGRMALGGGLGLAKGSGRVGKMFWDVFKDDMHKP